MSSLTTALVGLNFQCLAPGPVGSADADQVLIVNLNTANTVNLGSSPSNLALALGPLASITLTAPVYAVAASEPLLIGIAPGGGSYSPGSLNISGPVTAEISGPVTVEGTIDIGNTPAVTVSGTPTVTVSGTPTVNVGNTPSVTATISGTPVVDINSGNVTATISGTPTVGVTGTTDVQVQNATIDVIGSGGFVLPGQLASLFRNAATFTANAGLSAQLGSWNVENYSSILFYANDPAISSTATGASVCAHWFLQWADASGNVITQDSISCLIGGEFCVQVPVKGSFLNAFLFNTGSIGNISYAASQLGVWGDYRSIPDIQVMSYGIAALPAVTGWSLIQPAAPILTNSQWIASISQADTVSTSYLLPFPLWAGPVSGWYQETTQALNNNATIVDLTYAVQGSIPAGTGYQYGILANLPSAIQSDPVPVNYNSMPHQLAFLFKTTATAGAETFLFLSGGY